MRNHKIATPATSPQGEVKLNLSYGERKGAEGGGLFFGASIACEKKIRRPV